jgi:hypothetical protein
LRDSRDQVERQQRPEPRDRPQRRIGEAGDRGKRGHHGAVLPDPVGERAERRGDDDLGPDGGGKHGGDLRRVEAAPGEPHRPERQLDADHQKRCGIEGPEPGGISQGM